MPKSARKPLATLLIKRHMFDTVEEAQRWIMAGNVLVNEQRIDKPGMLVPADAHLRILGKRKYASRGGYKLEAALAYFHVDVTGCVALDSGASTGGFTDCLLQHGAAFVYAVEVGYGQLLGRLRADTRVRNLERTNLGDPALSTLDPAPNLITLDLSYLSLKKALPIAASLLAPDTRGTILALLKPLFEVEDAAARRSGHIDDPALFTDALHRILDTGAAAGLVPRGAAKLALMPKHGVNEYFVYFERGSQRQPWQYDNAILQTIVDSQGIGSLDP
jgi:23S rRNA (cytidine1920-2'-O)/16S rRNA (cytidine1409-2'-O)-methyltransferase